MAIESAAARAVLAEVRRLANRLPDINERLSHGTPMFFIRDEKVLCSVWEDRRSRDDQSMRSASVR